LLGVVIAIFVPQAQVCCVDAVGKKSAFVRHVAGALGLGNLSAIHGRVESLREPPFDTLISRAFASLEKFVGVTAAALRPGGIWVAMKGKVPQDEIADLPGRIEVFHVEHLRVPMLEAQRCLVWMREKSAPTAIPASLAA
jgi:16S rRNA (guanine527-N7)-methyltransferase